MIDFQKKINAGRRTFEALCFLQKANSNPRRHCSKGSFVADIAALCLSQQMAQRSTSSLQNSSSLNLLEFRHIVPIADTYAVPSDPVQAQIGPSGRTACVGARTPVSSPASPHER